jgi:hypothetical protein
VGGGAGNSDDAQAFLGPWQYRSGTSTVACAGQSRESRLEGGTRIVRGSEGLLVLGVADCPVKMNPVGTRAQLLPHQPCPPVGNGLGGTETTTHEGGTFVVEGPVATLSGSGTVLVKSGAAMETCSLRYEARLEKGEGGGPGTMAGACARLGVQTATEFETRFIVPRCGTSGCHQSVFPPKNLNMPSMIRSSLVGRPGQIFCKTDSYINVADPARSYVLATITATTERVTCPSGGEGGTRMPNKELMPTVAGERLTEDEIACFTWWVMTVSR